MLWSLIKVLLFVAIVAGIIYGTEQLLATGHGMQISVLNMEFTLGPIQSVLAIIAVFVAVWIVLRLVGLLVAVISFLLGDETAMTRYFSRSRERRGYQAISDALLALSAGETREASLRAGKAETLLKNQELTNLIAAEAAEKSGDKQRAEDAYKKMLENDRTRFIGIRGLMKQKLDAGETETALKLAEKALALKPKNVDTSDTLLSLQAQKDDWAGARRTLGTKVKYGSLPKDVFRRRDAVLALAEAEQKMEAAPTEAEEAALEANRLSPTFVPAAVAAARVFIARAKPGKAAKVLRTAWSFEPHPDLAAAYAEIKPDETAVDRIKRFGELTRIQTDHPETKMLLAELYIAAEDFPEARRALGDLVETDPTKRSLTLMAAIERGEGADDAVVKAWLAKALTAATGPQWISEATGKAYPKWQPVTDGGFDNLTWKRAESDEQGLTGNAEGMLPMIIGAIDDAKAAAKEDQSDVVESTATEAKSSTQAASDLETAKV
ncbi:MAG: heme biosynthesis HemY N-terminal domain-containing protein [Pseudomonadota bacterium]